MCVRCASPCTATMDDKRCERIAPEALCLAISYQPAPLYFPRVFFRLSFAPFFPVLSRHVNFDDRATHAHNRHCHNEVCENGRGAGALTHTPLCSNRTPFYTHTHFRHFGIQQLYFGNASVSKNTCRTPFGPRASSTRLRSLFL